MRILVVNWLDRENPQAGGAEIHLHRVFGGLASRGHEVTLVCSGFEGGEARTVLDGIRVHRTGGRHTFGLAAPLHVRRSLADERFDVVVEDLNKVPVFAPLWSSDPVVLLVHHLFGTAAFREASLPFAAATWMLERPIPRVFSGVPTVAVSPSTADDLARRGVDRARIEVIPNGVDLERYRPDPGTERFARPSLLYLGRLKRYKRLDLVLRAVSVLVERGLDCRLRVAGKGDHRSALEEEARRLGVAEHVDFLGWVSEERKLELLRRSWIHVLTSTKEGWGISNLEAAACGTPTVASDVPGLRDSVRHGETGYLVPHGDVEALVEAVGTLLADDGLRSELGRGARAFAEEFSWETVVDRWERCLGRVAEEEREERDGA